jgi:hypothetical protein
MVDIIMGTVRERTDITQEGTFETYYDIEFFVDDARHHLRMSPEKYTAKAAEEAVAKAAAEFAAVKGKKITPSKAA